MATVKETAKQKLAFECYYGLGLDRDFQRVADQTQIPLKTIEKWAKQYKWKEKADKNDLENIELIAIRNNMRTREKLEQYAGLIQCSIANFTDNLQGGLVNVTSIKDLDKLMRLEFDIEDRMNIAVEKDRERLITQSPDTGILGKIEKFKKEEDEIDATEDKSRTGFNAVEDVLDSSEE